MRKINNCILKNKTFFSLITVLATSLCMARVYSSDEWNEMRERDEEICSTNPVVIETQKFGDYKVTFYQADDWLCQRLEIQRPGEIVYSEAEVDAHFSFGADWPEGSQPLMNLRSDTSAQLVISKWTGGAHCCFSVLVFDIGSEFRKVDEIEGGNYYPYFEDIDRDGVSEVKVDDDFLAYRFSSFAFSAIGEVTLKYSNGHYEVSAEHMVKVPANWASLEKQIQGWQKELRERTSPDYPPPAFIQVVTDLVFTGNKTSALELIDHVWPADVPGKNEFLTSYEEALQDSKYYHDFEKKM